MINTKSSNIIARLSPVNQPKKLAIKDLSKFFKSLPRLDDEDISDFTKGIERARKMIDEKVFSKWD